MRWWRDRSGATSIEYAVIGSLIAATCLATIGQLGTGTNSLYGRVGTAFKQYLPW